MKPNPIKEKTLKFAIKTLDFCKYLDDQRQFVISNQLKRSGTSIGTQVFEAENTQSKADFILKLSIAQKVANEIKATLTAILKKLKLKNP